MKKLFTHLLVLCALPGMVNAQCATSSAPTNNCSFGDLISAFSLNSISATGNSGCGTSGYNSFSSPVWTLQIGSTYNWAATVGSGLYNEGVGIWIDLNNDGFYATTEFVASSAPAQSHSSTLAIPYTATAGTNLRMRVRCAYSSAVTSGQACTNSIGFGYGETEDYYVFLTCPAAMPTVAVVATSTLVCSASNSVMLTASGFGTYNWTGGITNGVAFNPTATTGYTVTVGVVGCPTSTNTASRTISVNATPTITGISSGSICPGGSFVMTPGGASTYSYISGSGTLTGSSATVAPIVTTSYTVSGTATNGCIASAGTAGYSTLTTLASPTLVLSSSSASVCPAVSVSLTVSGANTYTWTSPASNATLISVNPTATTIYTVSGTGTNVCNGIKTITVSVFPQPTVSVNSGSICAGQVFTMVPSGASTYTYSGGSNTVSPATSTLFTVLGTSTNGCVSATTAVSSISVVALPVVAVSGGTVCSGSAFIFLPSGATSYTFVNSSNPITPTVSASYSVIGTTSIGCVSLPAIANITVFSLPSLSVTATPSTMVICQNSPISMTVSGATTYTWNNTTSGATFSGTPLSSGNYYIVATDANGCINLANVPYTVNPQPNMYAVSSSTFLCLGKTATLTAGGALSYTWTTGSNTNIAVITPTATGVYGVIGTNTYNCTKTVTLSVLVNTITMSNSSNTAICQGNSANLTASGATAYTWTPGNSPFSAISVNPNATTTYTVNGKDSKNCLHSAAITVTVNSNPVMIASGSSSVICKGESATLTATGAMNYSWTTVGTSTANTSSSIVVSPANSSTYSYFVTGTDANGCMDMDTVILRVDKCVGITQITNPASGLSVYPNPNSGEFTVELNNGLTKHIQIADLTGRIIFTEVSVDNKTTINLNTYAKGIYYVKIQSDNAVEVIKVIKQ